ncbi:MAG: glycosyltransferase family 4 protein [Pirellulaceae bacterium]|nr:glycosyltransferase family 4 protein [Pirellulaceae bacterium]
MHRKILEIGPLPPPHAGWSVRIEYLMTSMRQQGIQCAALDLGDNRLARRAPESHIRGIRSNFDYALQVLLHLLRGYRIHNHLNSESWKAYCFVLYASILSVIFLRPSVLTWHGGLGGRYFPNPNSHLIDAFHWIIYRLNSQIICNDEKIKRHIVAYGISPEKVTPIPAFSEQYMEFDAVPLPAGISGFLKAHPTIIFSYVFFRPEFNLDVLLTGFAKTKKHFPDAGLCLVGCEVGSEPCTANLEQLGLKGSVYLAGDLGREQYLTLLTQADLFIRTPKRDGISSSVLEALALGIPVVAAYNTLRPPQVKTYSADDATELASAAISVLTADNESRKPARPALRDTIAEEVSLLVGTGSPTSRTEVIEHVD